MGEITINPIHNVHKKYRTMNLVNPYIFAPPVDLSTNTEIGGVASTISTPALLASKLAIDVSRITNFSIVGSDIKCRITGSYVIPVGAFQSTSITSYDDYANLVTDILAYGFAVCGNLKRCIFNGIVTLSGAYAFRNETAGFIDMLVEMKNLTAITGSAFYGHNHIKLTFYAPNLTSIGSSVLNDSVFDSITKPQIFYVNPSLQTSNAGAVEGDIAYTISKGTYVRYVTNFTAPNPITNLSTGTIYNTAIQLNFTPPSSTNAIDYYEIYVNGVYSKSIPKEGNFITGLSPSTNYSITVYAVDIFYNRSLVSNLISSSTTSSNSFITTGDSDANTYITASGITDDLAKESSARLFVDLKNNSLYTKCQAIYLFKGSTSSQQKYNAKNPLDTNAAFRLIFSGTGTYSDAGFQTNGSNSYANTYFAPNINQNVNSNGMTVVVGTNNSVNTDNCTVGSYNSESQMSVFTSKGNNTSYYRQSLLNNRGSAIIQTGVNDAKGIWTTSKQSASVGKLFRNQTLIGSGSGGGSLPTYNLYIGALNYIGSLNGVSHQRIQMVILHEGLSNAEITTLQSIIDLSETIAGRKTW